MQPMRQRAAATTHERKKMKQTELIVLGLAGLAVFMIVKPKGTAANPAQGTGGAVRNAYETVSEIFDSVTNRAFGNGWRYFSDGTAISPEGDYYQGGQLIWTAPKTGGATGSW